MLVGSSQSPLSVSDFRNDIFGLYDDEIFLFFSFAFLSILACATSGARCNVPDLRFAPTGFQYLSSASHVGFQYCAVGSMTTSSDSCSKSHAANDRSCSGLLLNILRSNWYSLSISTSDTTTASIFLWTSIPAIL